jgi:hypothetical protein
MDELWSDASDLEIEACRLAWEKRGGSGDPSPQEAATLLAEVRERQRVIERSAFEMVLRQTREGRRYPRRHQRLALLVMLPILIVIIALSVWLAR